MVQRLESVDLIHAPPVFCQDAGTNRQRRTAKPDRVETELSRQPRIGLGVDSGLAGFVRCAPQGQNGFGFRFDGGDAKAQFNVGLCYLEGRVFPQDDHEAVVWLKRVAEQGTIDVDLGECYAKGRGIEKDLIERTNGLICLRLLEVRLPEKVSRKFKLE